MKLAHLTLIFMVALSGCFGGGGGSGGDDTTSGQLTPTGIKGIHYQTSSQTGMTDRQGTFRYYPGERLALRIGNFALYSDIPADSVVTPLEFMASQRDLLRTAGRTDEGLLSHRPVELQLIDNIEIMNVTRFLLSLNWEQTTGDGKGVDIRERVVSQLSAALPDLTESVDFSVSEADFVKEGTSPSPANQLLAGICFYADDNELCGEPPTLEEIDNAPEAPEDPDDRDPDVDYKQDLENLRERIFNAIRTVDDVSPAEARDYLKRELDIASRAVANQYFLTASTATYPASDTGIKTIQIHKIGGEADIGGLEAISTNDVNVIVHSFDRQSATVEYFIDGEGGEEGEILVNFRPSDGYRWVKKQVRVIIK